MKQKSKIIKKGYINVYSQLTPEEEKQVFYLEKYKQLNSKWDATEVQMVKLFQQAAGKNKQLIVFDAGCGHGNYVIDENANLIKKACGVDLCEQETKGNICLDEIKYASLEKIPYPNNTFDIVISTWVLEHIANPVTAFKEVYRVLKPNGSFIFCAPNKYYFLTLLKRLIPSHLNDLLVSKVYGRKEKDVYKAFYKASSVEELRNQLGEAGFSSTSIQLNFDPRYTSLNSYTYKITAETNTKNKLMGKFTKAHIVGDAVK